MRCKRRRWMMFSCSQGYTKSTSEGHDSMHYLYERREPLELELQMKWMLILDKDVWWLFNWMIEWLIVRGWCGRKNVCVSVYSLINVISCVLYWWTLFLSCSSTTPASKCECERVIVPMQRISDHLISLFWGGREKRIKEEEEEGQVWRWIESWDCSWRRRPTAEEGTRSGRLLYFSSYDCIFEWD